VRGEGAVRAGEGLRRVDPAAEAGWDQHRFGRGRVVALVADGYRVHGAGGEGEGGDVVGLDVGAGGRYGGHGGWVGEVVRWGIGE
jgi:hypothetical protein